MLFASYFLRAMKPVTSEPRPRSPSKGSGDPVCGSLPELLPELSSAGSFETFFSVCA